MLLLLVLLLFTTLAVDLLYCKYARQLPTRTLQIQMFPRDSSTGELSVRIPANVGTYTSSVQGVIAGFVVSDINDQVVLGMSNDDEGTTGGVVVLDITVRTINPARVLACRLTLGQSRGSLKKGH